MQIKDNFAQNFSFANNFSKIFEQKTPALTKVEQAIQPLVSKYGSTDTNDLSNVTKGTKTTMEKLQDNLIEEDEALSAVDFIDENGDGIQDVEDSLTSMESILDGVTDEEDMQGIQDELTSMMEEINKIATNAFGEINKIADESSGITSNGDNSFTLSIGDKEIDIQLMSFDSESLGLNAIDVTKEGGLEEAYDILTAARDAVAGELEYLGNVKQEIYDTFDAYKAEVEESILSQLGNVSDAQADDILARLQAIVLKESENVVLAQLDQKPENVLALVN